VSVEADFAFGFGCFHFGGRPDRLSITWGQHFTNVETALRDIGAYDITLSYDDEQEVELMYFGATSTGPLEEGGGIVPPGAFTEISFRLPIHEAFVSARQRRRLGSMEYQVHMRYGYHQPVAMVVSPRARDPEPSTGVRLTREFLTDRLGASETIRFEFLGPSPFHAECYLIPQGPADSEDVSITAKRTRARGYDLLRFSYDPAALDPETALLAVLEAAEEELSIFYQVEWLNVSRIHAWDRIDSSVEKLVRLHSTRGFRAAVNQLLRIPGLAGQALIEETSFEADLLLGDRALDRSVNETYGHGGTLFEDWIRGAIRDRFTFPTQQVATLISRFEARRAATLERVALLVGPLLGVVVGALLAALVK
jgi:hypothetical protein